jgi:hypothetical protein
VNYFRAVYNIIALIAKGNKSNQAILNKDIPTAAISSIAVLETGELRPTGRLAGRYVR